MEHFLIVYSAEYSFSNRLCLYLEKREELNFQIIPFSDESKVLLFLESNSQCVFIVDEQLLEKIMKSNTSVPAVEKLIVLTSSKSNIKTDCIYKYQSAETITKEIIQICSEVDSLANEIWGNSLNKNHVSGGMKEITGIYSPIKRCLQTSFSLTYCSLKAKKQKTLYINFEVFSGFSNWFSKEYGTDLMDLLYFVNAEPQKFIMRLSGMVERIGDVYYIPPAISYEDFMEVTKEQWIQFLEMLVEYSDYEVIVLDLGEHVRGLFSILERCTKVFTITKQDPLAISKVTEYEEMMRISKKESILNKTKKYNLPVFKDVSRIAEDLPYSQLASYMKNMMKEEFE